MTLWLIVKRSLKQHLLSTVITALSLALAAGLLMSVWVVKRQSQETFTGMTGGWDAVLGARGARLQLVLNAIFHLEASPGNLPWEAYQQIAANPAVAKAVPIAVGDNYRGFRIVGVTTNLFESTPTPAPGSIPLKVAAGGRLFEDGFREAVLGSFAAAQLRLKVGDSFHPYHGLTFDEKQQHSETYLVTGILEPSNTPVDRVIWIPLMGLQNMSGHSADTATDVSAVLVKLRSPIAGQSLDTLYNKQGDRFTFAWPIGQVMAQLFNKIGWFDRILTLVAYLVALVAAGSVLASIYNSMSARRRDIAIMRALGARKHTVFSAILLEAVAIACLGVVAGWVLYGIILSIAAAIIRTQTGVVLNVTGGETILWTAPLALIGLSALAGILPAWKAYRTPVAETLSPES